MLQHLNIKLMGMELYDFFNVISFFSLLSYNLIQLNQKKKLLSQWSQRIQGNIVKKSKGTFLQVFGETNFWALFEVIIISMAQYLPAGYLNFSFGELFGTGANYFGLAFFCPLIVIAFCLCLRINPLKQLDLITPAYPLALSFSKFACFCCGCCGGMECSFGMYNYYKDELQFPVQLVEVALAVLLFFFLHNYRKIARVGTMYPTYLTLYSVTRFFSEFLRGEKNVWGMLKLYHIFCIAGIIVGIVELALVHKFGEKITTSFEQKAKKVEQLE
ncbi:MAG: prolipoprotein diacylglyceryl transferase [Tyzzerella sp.]|nr:prolipoprotein diacylglyceryl transferase [Tyzzerella sp.]